MQDNEEVGAANEPFAPGEVFAGRYRMVTRLGQGPAGEVWRADDLVLEMPVAIKLMHPADAGELRLLYEEIGVARQVSHPAVCRVFDVGEERGSPFVVMELVDGEDLAALVKRVGRLPSEKVAEIGRQLCAVLSAAHGQGLYHGNLKPANVLIDRNGAVRITDFGFASGRTNDPPSHLALPPSRSALRWTSRGASPTDATYLAPEQLTGSAPVSERTDVYALGLVLHELLAGKHVLDRQDAADRRRVPAAPGIDARLERVIMQALSPDPADRPQSASAMAAGLTVVENTSGPGRRRFWLAAAGLAVAASVLALVLGRRAPGAAHTLTEQDTILLTDFGNSTGEAVFDGALKVALAVAVEQSPFLKIFPDERVRQALLLMNRSPDERITRPIAREIAQREGLKALLTGSIGSLGRNYVIAIEAVNAGTGDVMAREQVEVAGQEQVLMALGQAAVRLRERLGESLASIQKFDVPLPRATTSSLEALHSYALALDQDRLVARAGAVPHLKRAIEIDPAFALAHALLSGVYANARQSTLAPQFARTAFELRDRVSERERFFISWRYFHDATQDWDKAFELARTWTATYPREPFAFNSLGAALSCFGQYERAVEAFRTATRLDPRFVAPHENLASALLALNRPDAVKQVVRDAGAERPDWPAFRQLSYLAALVEGDAPGMARELEAARRLPDPMTAADWEARLSAFTGRLGAAHDQFRRAIRLATESDLRETAALWSSMDAEAHALGGQCAQARSEAAGAVALSRDNFTLERSGRAIAVCGAAGEATRVLRELADRFPEATLTQRIQRPIISAALAIQGGDVRRGLALLEAVRPYDHARGAEFWPSYLRGQVHLALKNGGEAATQFEAILSHRGEAPASPLYPLAHLGLARAAALAGDGAKARRAYEAFLALWRDADSNLQPLQEARRELSTLNSQVSRLKPFRLEP